MNQTMFEPRDCQLMLRQLDPYIDNELPREQMLAVSRHLDDCPACSRELLARKEVSERLRRIVREDVAPPHLRAVIRGQLQQPQKRSLWAAWSWAAAAAAMICLTVGVAYQLGHLRFTVDSQNAFIETVSNKVATIFRPGIRDHIHCSVYRTFPKEPPTMQELAAKMDPAFQPLIPAVKDKVPAGYRLVIAHSCGFQGRRYVHMSWKNGSSLLSLVVTKKENGESFQTEEVIPAMIHAGIPVYQTAARGYDVVGFETGSHLVYVVSDLSGQPNRDVMLAMAPEVKSFLQRVEIL
jgi:anti-sigma factor (TIGR02949 family)